VSARELIAVAGKTPIGRVLRNNNGRLKLQYEEAWRSANDAFPLSLSMPLTSAEHSHEKIDAFLWGLLPDNATVLDNWGRQFQVSPRNAFALLSHVGEDCAGAVQFVPPERVEALLAKRSDRVDWLTEQAVAERLRILQADHSAWRLQGDTGLFSLAGAQPKTALLFEKDRWGVPSGRTPTTHIIKPCVPGFDGLVENEHLCQDIAARLGMPAASSHVLALDQMYIVVERYDRLPPREGSSFAQRIHQEDICQALGLMPGKKYQEDGGPGIEQIVALIRRVSSDPDVDVDRFLQANMFNWLIGGTDAHAKNYSLLIGAGGEIRLAPLYDLSSQLPYPELIGQRVSMKIGNSYDIGRVGMDDWRKLARDCAVEEERVLTLLTGMAKALPDEISAAREQALIEGLSESIIAPLARQLITHVGARFATITAVRSSR